MKSLHEYFMHRCLELAAKGRGNTSPNPMVGSVVVHKSKIIGEGYHRKCGEAHAEVNAINSVKNAGLFSESTIYVNLEPCSHYGRTPPCCDLIIAKKIPKIVIGTIDNFKQVAGRGIEKLTNAGSDVVTGILADSCIELNKRFFTYHSKNRPYIILKWAQTLDGYLAPVRSNVDAGSPVWISADCSRMLVHKWRAEEDAILVGTNTALEDNPKLTIRDWYGTNPIRIVIDRQGRLSLKHALFDHSSKTIVFTQKQQLNEQNLEFVVIDFNCSKFEVLKLIINELYNRNIQSVIIEGGIEVLNSFIGNELWDEARVFIGNKHFAGGLLAPEMPLLPSHSVKLQNDLLLEYRNPIHNLKNVFL